MNPKGEVETGRSSVRELQRPLDELEQVVELGDVVVAQTVVDFVAVAAEEARW